MDQIEPNGLKWTYVDWNGLKCYIDVIQLERNNNKCYALDFWYYIDLCTPTHQEARKLVWVWTVGMFGFGYYGGLKGKRGERGHWG